MMGSWRDYDYLHSSNNFGKVKKINYGNTMQNVGVSSGTPLSLPKVGDTLPMVETTKAAPKVSGTIGPVQWSGPSSAITKYTPTALPKVEVKPISRLSSAIDNSHRAWMDNEVANPATVNRIEHVAKGIYDKSIATPKLLGDLTQQTLSDWFDKVKTVGMQKAMSDYAYNLDNPSYSIGNPLNINNSEGYRAYRMANEHFNEALEGLTPEDRRKWEIGIGFADAASTVPWAIVNPVLPVAIQTAKSAADKAYRLTNEGKTTSEALGRGGLSGLIDAAVYSLGFKNLNDLARQGGKPFIQAFFKQFGIDAGAGAVSYIANYAADVSNNDENAEFNLKDMVTNALVRGTAGAATAGLGSLVGNIRGNGTGANKSLPSVQNLSTSNNLMLPGINTMPIVDNLSVLPSVKNYIANKTGPTLLPAVEANIDPELSINNSHLKVNNEIPIKNAGYSQSLPKAVDSMPSVWDTAPESAAEKGTLKQTQNNSEKDTSVINQLRNNILELSKMERVSAIRGDEFQKGDKKLIEAVKEFFDGIGGKVQRDGFGEVLLTKKGIKSSIGHGIGRAKSAAFKAVPDVIKNGKQIGHQQNWKDRGYDTYVFAAPVSIDNKTAYIATVVKHDNTANRFYLHEIVDETGNILYLAENKDGLNTFKTTSTINASSGVSLPSINIVPNSVQKVNGANNYNVTQEGYLPKVGDAMPSVWDAKPMPTAGENVLPYIDTNRTDKSDSIVEQLRSNISNLSGMKAVKSLTGEEFLKSDKGLVEQVMDFIKDYITQNGPIKRAGFGEINITKRGVKSSLAHGIGREKAIAFAAIPEVLKSGKEIGFQRNWKNRNYDTHIFAAPVKIKNEVAYVAAVVTSSDNSNRYYLHEVVDSNGNIIEINKGDGAQNLDVSAGLKTRLIDTKVGNTSPNNIVPNSVQKVNTSKPLRIADYSDDSLVEAAKSFSPDEQKIITDYVTSELENPPDNKQMVMEREKGYTLSKRMYTDDEQAIIDKYKAKLSSQKDKYEKKISKTEGLYKDKIKASKEKQKTAKLGNEVLKVAKRIQKDFKHMPPDMKEKAYAALKNIDTKAKSISKKSIDNAYELKSYVEAMQALDPNFVVSKGIQDRIDRLSKNVRISNLTYNELLDLSDTLSGLVHEFKNYNKMLGTAQKQKVSDMSAAAQREVNSSKSQRNGFINKTFKVESLNPTTVFNVLGNFTKGGAMETIRDEFIKGQRKSIKYVKDATKLFDEFLNNKEYSGELETWGGKKAKWIDTGLSDGNGKIYMTPGERIDIYLHSLNSNNRATMMNGGYTFISKESLIKGDNENLYKGMKPVKLTSDDITRITSGMTAAEKEFADIAHKYFNSTSKTSINETSMVTNGYERADVDNYYPKSIDKDAIVTGFALDDEGGNINEPSYLQERNGNTGAPIKGRNAVEVVLNSINEVGKYYGFAIPMRDFTMVWNSRGNGTTTLKKAVADTFGNDMVAYINKFAKDINSSKTNRYYVDKLAGKLMRNYAASVLNFNPKVSLQQTASLITAAPEVGYESIVKALFGTPKELRRQIIREIDSRSGYRWDRAFRGNSTAELSMLTKNGGFKSQQNGKSQKFKDIANPTKWIRNMDLWATDEIAYAAYYNVVNEGKYKMGSSEFWNAVTDRYETTLENTQPMYNIMQRTGIARSDSTLAYAFNMFATQRNQNYNMAYNALGEYQSVKRSGGNKKKARAKFNKTMGALFMSTAVVTLMTTLAQYVTNRKKLEDENGDITLESFMKYYRSAFLSSAAGNVIGGSQIYNGLNSLIKGEAYYGTEEPTLDLVNDLVTSSIGLGKKLADYAIGFKESYEAGYLPEYMSKEKSEALKAVHDSVIAITKLFGIPMANAEKYTTGLVGTLFPEIETAYNSMYSGLTNATIKKASGRNQDAYIGMALKDRVSDNLDKNSISEIQSLYHATDGSSKVLPRYEAPDNISKEATQKRKNVDYDLTIADKVKFEDKYSDILEEELPELLNSSFYKGLTTEEQLYAIYYLYSYAEEQSKKAVVKEYAVSDNYNMKNIGISDYRSYIKDKEEKERKKKK